MSISRNQTVDLPAYDLLRTEYEVPLLAHLLWLGTREAQSTKIEWLIDKMQNGEIVRDLNFNYAQINRTVWNPNMPGKNPDGSPRTFKDFLKSFLQDLEATLWYGQREFVANAVHPLGMCGGVDFYLGREPNEYDTLELRLLCPITRRYEESRIDPKGDIEELMIEYSLLVYDGGGLDAPPIVTPPEWLREKVNRV